MKVRENEFFPCDLYLLNSSAKKGICFVETKNLDGETNLKHKQANKDIIHLAQDVPSICENLDGARIECETPNEYLYKFEGNLYLGGGKSGDEHVVPMNPDEVLLRGSSLRNTEWVYGICLFTGHETKIMKNGTNARSKKSKIEVSTNNYIIVIMLIQVAVCLFGAAYAVIWQNQIGEAAWYLDYTKSKRSIFV